MFLFLCVLTSLLWKINMTVVNEKNLMRKMFYNTWSTSPISALIFYQLELRLWTTTRALEVIKIGRLEGKV